MNHTETHDAIAFSEKSKKQLSTYFISFFGTFVEYYDYTLYGFCAALLSQYFFTDSNSTIALLKTYGLFAIAAMGKPVGSIIFGWLGDRFGRGFVLRRSMVGIAIPTMIIALTPGQHEWGVFSAVIILVCRFMQGVFVSGESDGVRIYVYESDIGRYPYIANALVGLSMIVGAFVASYGAIYALNHVGSWMWRLPFIFGGLMGLFVFYLRRRITEKKPKKLTGSSEKVKLNWRSILATILMTGSVGGIYHLFFVFRPTFVAQLTSAVIQSSDAQWSTTFALYFFMPTTILSAILSEYIGGKRVILLGSISLIALSLFFANELVESLNNPFILGGFGVAIGILFSPGFVLVLRQFDPSLRFRCASIGHSTGSLLLSGTAPFMATMIWKQFGSPLALSYHLIFLAGLLLAALLLLSPAHEPARH